MIMDQDMKIKILRNTITVFNGKGLKLTMDDIAEQMGISKKTIYKYYDSKEDIFDNIVDYIFDDIKRTEQEILNEDGLELQDRVRRLLAAFPERFTEIDFAKLGDLKDKYPKIYKKLKKEVLRDGHLKEKQDQLHRGIESGSRHTSDGHQSLRGHAYGQIKQCIR